MNRPHCQAPRACIAKTPDKHCVRCSASSPEVRARKSAGIASAMAANPERRAAKAAHARALSADPEIVAKRAAAQTWTKGDPAWQARFAARCAEAKAERMKDPAFVEQLREAGRQRARDGGWSHLNTPEMREKARHRIRAAALAWCPEEYWPLNASLKSKGFLLDERKRMIAEEIERASPVAVARRQIDQFNKAQRARAERERRQAY